MGVGPMGGAVIPEFWAGKRVLITGHTGFKGSWISLWLQKMGAEVFGFSLPPPTKPALFEEANVADGMVSVTGDISDFNVVQHAVNEILPDIVIHMAAQPLVRYSYQQPIETFSTNVMGTIHLLEAVRNVGSAKVVINVTTDKCYENKEMFWGYREDEPMGGYDPYSSSKGCSELLTRAYKRSYYENADISLASARAGNVIGGGDWSSDRLLPDILRALQSKRSVVIRNPNAIRPWQHVLEPLSGYLVLAQHLYFDGSEFSGAWNFGPNDEDARPVQWIVENMIGRWGSDCSWQLDGYEHPHEANYLKLDISKAKSLLGWKPVWNLNQALEKIIDWHKLWISGTNMRVICEQQIKAYETSSIKVYDE